MRSNIASTCGSARRPAELMPAWLLEARQEGDELLELLRALSLQRRERRHRRSRVEQRPRDCLAAEARPDLRQGRPGTGVAVLANLVAAQAARRRSNILALRVLGRDLHVDLGWRPRDGAEDRQGRH